MNSKKWILTFWIFFGIYLLSFFLPSAYMFSNSDKDSELMMGYDCARYALLSLLEINPISILGNIPNFVVFYWVFIFRFKFIPGKDVSNKNFVLLCLVFLGTVVWLTMGFKLTVGYFVWTVSIWGMGIANLKFPLVLAEEMLKNNGKDNSQQLKNKSE